MLSVSDKGARIDETVSETARYRMTPASSINVSGGALDE